LGRIGARPGPRDACRDGCGCGCRPTHLDLCPLGPTRTPHHHQTPLVTRHRSSLPFFPCEHSPTYLATLVQLQFLLYICTYFRGCDDFPSLCSLRRFFLCNRAAEPSCPFRRSRLNFRPSRLHLFIAQQYIENYNPSLCIEALRLKYGVYRHFSDHRRDLRRGLLVRILILILELVPTPPRDRTNLPPPPPSSFLRCSQAATQ
jgi:hypothetical protein